jgi:pyruvate/2-oxoglutarate dehydrogenase complex dihydrolipoamide dehydrogenase (E3) component
MPEFKGMLRETSLVNLPVEHKSREDLFQTFDQVIAATGFKFNMDNFDFLSPELRSKIKSRKSLPVLDTKFQTSVPGLYFSGGISELYFGTALKFIIGSHYSAKTIARVLRD